MPPIIAVPSLPARLAISRRSLLGAAAGFSLGGLGGCSTPLPLDTPAPAAGAAAANALLQESADAHGWAAYRQLSDINIAYAGQWRPFIDRLQPEVVDAGFRGASEERLLPAQGINAQHYRGSKGEKFVSWRRSSRVPVRAGAVAVWFNGKASQDPLQLSAAAVVAEGYGLFLLGPLWLAGRSLPVQREGSERVDGRVCDVLQVWLSPGLGLSAQDRVTLFIDQDTRIARRIRFSLEGHERTRGAVAEVDTYEHERRFGVLWPMRSFERVLHPIAIPAHDWRISGLDVNRGYGAEALAGPTFGGAAAAPAQPI